VKKTIKCQWSEKETRDRTVSLYMVTHYPMFARCKIGLA